jgi:hypothetical protein
MKPALDGTNTTSNLKFNPALSPDDIEFNAPPGWHRLKHLIQPALDRSGNTHSLDDVKEEIQQGKAQMWPGEDCVVITNVVDYPQKKVLLYWIAGGDLTEIMSLEDIISDFARGHGCTSAIIHGRRGWLKALTGWDERGTTVTKEL